MRFFACDLVIRSEPISRNGKLIETTVLSKHKVLRRRSSSLETIRLSEWTVEDCKSSSQQLIQVDLTVNLAKCSRITRLSWK